MADMSGLDFVFFAAVVFAAVYWVAALACVDLVVPFDEETPRELIVACLPDILVKGGDYDATTTVGAAEVIGWGGRFAAIPFVPERSTTALLTKIRR